MGVKEIDQCKNRSDLVQTYCTVQGEVYGLLGAVLVVKSDSNRKEGPAIPLLHTLRV